MREYDLIVIGAGPGGYEAAFEAADLGMKTALIEKDAPGGTCLNRGCIPTKSLLHGAERYRAMKESEAFGVLAGEVSFDLARMQARKRQVVVQLRTGIESTAKRKKVDLIQGTGTVAGPGTVLVRDERDGEERLKAAHILIATCSVPVKLPIPGTDLPGVVNSDALLESEKSIGRLVIIGGGVIGAEFAALYRALGTEVTVLEAMPQLLPNLDREMAQSLKMQMKKQGIQVCTGARVEEIHRAKTGGLVCAYSLEKGQQAERAIAEADTVLVCVGRKPCTEGLFAEGAVPETDRGRIRVNGRFETSLPGVYAIGDVIGGIMLAHAAAAEGKNAVRYMKGLPPAADLRFVPSCVYTDPEIACVGMTEEEAKAAGLEPESRKALMGANGKTLLTGGDRGYIRAVWEKKSGKLLGAQMMCQRATDMIGEFTLALSAGLTREEMARAIRPHPTFSEAITEALR